MGSKLYFGGVPTAPDVDALMKECEATVGTSIDYDQISEIIRVKVATSRFHTVITSWRKRLFRERGIQTKADGGAIHFLTAEATLTEVARQPHIIGRAAGRMAQRAAAIRTEQLQSDDLRGKHRLLIREAAAMVEAARQSARNLAEPAPKTASVIRIAGK